MIITEILNLLEAISLGNARQYVKLGRKNEEDLDPDIKEMYDKIFKTESRVYIGKIPTKVSASTVMEINKYYNLAVKSINELISASEYPRVIQLKNNSEFNGVSDYALDHIIDGYKNFVTGQIYDFKSKKWFYIKHILRMDNKFQSTENYKILQRLISDVATDFKGKLEGSIGVYLSKHPIDVAGMSTGRSWTSCKDIHRGCNAHYLDEEVGKILVAYAVDVENKSIQNPNEPIHNPIARLNIVPVEHKFTPKLFVSDRVYPRKYEEFYKFVCSYLDKLGIPRSKSGNLMYDIYNDYGIGNYAGMGFTQENFEAAVEEVFDVFDFSRGEMNGRTERFREVFDRLYDEMEQRYAEIELDYGQRIAPEQMYEIVREDAYHSYRVYEEFIKKHGLADNTHNKIAFLRISGCYVENLSDIEEYIKLEDFETPYAKYEGYETLDDLFDELLNDDDVDFAPPEINDTVWGIIENFLKHLYTVNPEEFKNFIPNFKRLYKDAIDNKSYSSAYISKELFNKYYDEYVEPFLKPMYDKIEAQEYNKHPSVLKLF